MIITDGERTYLTLSYFLWFDRYLIINPHCIFNVPFPRDKQKLSLKGHGLGIEGEGNPFVF